MEKSFTLNTSNFVTFLDDQWNGYPIIRPNTNKLECSKSNKSYSLSIFIIYGNVRNWIYIVLEISFALQLKIQLPILPE